VAPLAGDPVAPFHQAPVHHDPGAGARAEDGGERRCRAPRPPVRRLAQRQAVGVVGDAHGPAEAPERSRSSRPPFSQVLFAPAPARWWAKGCRGCRRRSCLALPVPAPPPPPTRRPRRSWRGRRGRRRAAAEQHAPVGREGRDLRFGAAEVDSYSDHARQRWRNVGPCRKPCGRGARVLHSGT
jgi:hypothetical protein